METDGIRFSFNFNRKVRKVFSQRTQGVNGVIADFRNATLPKQKRKQKGLWIILAMTHFGGEIPPFGRNDNAHFEGEIPPFGRNDNAHFGRRGGSSGGGDRSAAASASCSSQLSVIPNGAERNEESRAFSHALRKAMYFILFLLVFQQITAQMTITGFIMDDAGIPIKDVHIVCETTNQGTVSDEAGWFSMNLSEQPTILTLSHIAFFPKQIDITKETIAQGKKMGEIELGIVLKAKSQMLSAVEITDGKVTIAYNDAKKWILDYAFIGKDEILLLMIEKNKKYIQLIDTNNKTVSKKRVDGKYNGFHKDCLGNVFLKSDDEVCQVFLQDNNEFLLAYQISMEVFLNSIERMVVVTPNSWYVKDVAIRDQNITYYKFDTLTKQVVMLYNVHDETGEKIQAHQQDLRKEQDVYKKAVIEDLETAERRIRAVAGLPDAARFIKNIITQTNILIATFEQSNLNIKDYISFYDYLLSQSPYSPLLKINDMLYIFDHVNGQIVAYDIDGNLIKEVEISYHTTQNYGKEVIVDEEESIAFVKFVNNGYVTLRQINPDTGNFTGNDIVLEKHVYPKSIKIRGDYIYYLARGMFENEDKYFLWKQHLE